jgi:hypothetical protein
MSMKVKSINAPEQFIAAVTRYQHEHGLQSWSAAVVVLAVAGMQQIGYIDIRTARRMAEVPPRGGARKRK